MKNWIILIDEENHNSTEWTIRPRVSESWPVSLQFQLHLSKVSVMFTNKTIVMKMVIFFSFTEYSISLNSLQYKGWILLEGYCIFKTVPMNTFTNWKKFCVDFLFFSLSAFLCLSSFHFFSFFGCFTFFWLNFTFNFQGSHRGWLKPCFPWIRMDRNFSDAKSSCSES